MSAKPALLPTTKTMRNTPTLIGPFFLSLPPRTAGAFAEVVVEFDLRRGVHQILRSSDIFGRRLRTIRSTTTWFYTQVQLQFHDALTAVASTMGKTTRATVAAIAVEEERVTRRSTDASRASPRATETARARTGRWRR